MSNPYEDQVHTYRHANCHSCGQMVKQIDPEEQRRVWEVEQQKAREEQENEWKKQSQLMELQLRREEWLQTKKEIKQLLLLPVRPANLWKATKWLTIRLPVHLYRGTKFLVLRTPKAIWRATKFIGSRIVRIRPRHFKIAAVETGKFFRDASKELSDRETWLRPLKRDDTTLAQITAKVLLSFLSGAIFGVKITLGIVGFFVFWGIATIIRTRVENRSLGKALLKKAKESIE